MSERRRMRANTVLCFGESSPHVVEHDENHYCAVHPACLPVEPERNGWADMLAQVVAVASHADGGMPHDLAHHTADAIRQAVSDGILTPEDFGMVCDDPCGDDDCTCVSLYRAHRERNER